MNLQLAVMYPLKESACGGGCLARETFDLVAQSVGDHDNAILDINVENFVRDKMSSASLGGCFFEMRRSEFCF